MNNSAKNSRKPAVFLTVAKFIQATQHTTLHLVENKTNGKLSILADKDQASSAFYKTQQDIDPEQEIVFLVPLDENKQQVLEQACLVNAESNFEVVAQIA